MGPQRQSRPWIRVLSREGARPRGRGPRKDLQREGWPKAQGKRATRDHAQPARAAENTRNLTHARSRCGPSAYHIPGAMPGTGDTVTSQTGDGPCLHRASGSPAEGWGEANPKKITLMNMSLQTQMSTRA